MDRLQKQKKHVLLKKKSLHFYKQTLHGRQLECVLSTEMQRPCIPDRVQLGCTTVSRTTCAPRAVRWRVGSRRSTGWRNLERPVSCGDCDLGPGETLSPSSLCALAWENSAKGTGRGDGDKPSRHLTQLLEQETVSC